MAKAKKAEKKQNISINTEEPLEEKDMDANPLSEEGEEEDELELDNEKLNPFGDRWEE